MKTTRLLHTLVLFLLLASACAPKEVPLIDEKSAAQTVQDFYNIHIPPGRYDTGNPRDFEASPGIHPDLVAKIQAARNTEMGIGFDPFLCAQAWPQTWGIASTVVKADSAEVLLQTTYGESKVPVTVYLTKHEGRWKIIGTNCFPEMTANS